MANPILANIFARVQTSRAESLLLQIIAHAANVVGHNARLSYAVLAARANFSERWCMAVVASLEAKHLLRVQRTRLHYAWHAVNCYSVVQPWLASLTYRDALKRQQQRHREAQADTARLASERCLHPEPTQRKIPTPCTHEECLKAGLTPGSRPYRLARGWPEEDGQQTGEG